MGRWQLQGAAPGAAPRRAGVLVPTGAHCTESHRTRLENMSKLHLITLGERVLKEETTVNLKGNKKPAMPPGTDPTAPPVLLCRSPACSLPCTTEEIPTGYPAMITVCIMNKLS